MRKLISTLAIICFMNSVFGVEGMWIPTLLKKYNLEEMQKMGFKLSAEDVYNVNHASMKDAVVLFGSGCTGELISGDGLLITNHHCGFGQIQKHSTLDHDYLSNGFWAKNRSEELANPGLTVQFLVKMEEVTQLVMKGVRENQNEAETKKAVTDNIDALKKALSDNNTYLVDIKPLFYGNQYFAYVYEVFRDVRLVGAPPASIGKFGGDTDNWVWPRHTGDFSLFRIYAGKDNKPASFSPENVPYHPKKYFPINLKGVNEGDFTMVFGFPGSTQEYLPSPAIQLLIEKSNPNKVAVRTAKLAILENQMGKDPKVKIQYASKYAGSSNSWKKWQGETKGLVRLMAVELKQKEEKQFTQWIQQDSERTKKYGNIFNDFQRDYAALSDYQVAYDLYNEIIFRGSDIFNLMSRFDLLVRASEDSAKLSKQKKMLEAFLPVYLKDYDRITDELVLSSLLNIMVQKVDSKFLPELISSSIKNFSDKGYVQNLYRNSIFSDSVKTKLLLQSFSHKTIKRLQKDKLYSLYVSFINLYSKEIEPPYQKLNQAILKTQKGYMAAILEKNSGERLMADANLTLRVAYGKVEGYEPMDGVRYQYYTTLGGIIEKEDSNNPDFVVPEKLKTLFQTKEYGIYTNGKGEIPVAFCASNHTTGGNSGSPVLNANGELIGVNFDRCWEGTMSDILFDPDRCRNISLDIRYALFIIDKFAGAGYLLKEMQLIQ